MRAGRHLVGTGKRSLSGLELQLTKHLKQNPAVCAVPEPSKSQGAKITSGPGSVRVVDVNPAGCCLVFISFLPLL